MLDFCLVTTYVDVDTGYMASALDYEFFGTVTARPEKESTVPECYTRLSTSWLSTAITGLNESNNSKYTLLTVKNHGAARESLRVSTVVMA